MPYCANADCKEPYDKVFARVSGLTYFHIDNGEWCCSYECYKREMARRFQVNDTQLAPVGLMPRRIWLEKRLDDVMAAIDRYNAAGVSVPDEWILELAEIVATLTE